MSVFEFEKQCIYCDKPYISNTTSRPQLCYLCIKIQDRIFRHVASTRTTRLSEAERERIRADKTTRSNRNGFDIKRPHRYEKSHPDFGKY